MVDDISGHKVEWLQFLPQIALWVPERFPRKYRYFASKCSQIVRKWSYDATKMFSDSWRFQLWNTEISIGNTFEISTIWSQNVNSGYQHSNANPALVPRIYLLWSYGRNFESVADWNFCIPKLKSSAVWEHFCGIIGPFAYKLGAVWSEMPVFSSKSVCATRHRAQIWVKIIITELSDPIERD